MGVPAKSPCDEALIRSTPASAVCARRAEPWVLAATILGSSMAFIDGTVVNIALPVLQADLGASVAGVQWVVVSYALFLAALLLPAGAFADRYGRRRIFAAGTALFAVASAWCALTPSTGSLIAARAVQGVGAALLIPTSLAIIGVSFAPERRGRAIGTWSAFTAMTTALGPVLGGWLVEFASWRAVFYINVPLAAVVIAILYWRVPESRSDRAVPSIDWLGTILAIIGLGGIVYGLIESANLGWTHPIVVSSVLVGATALSGFIIVETRIATPLMPLGLFRSRVFSGTNLLTFLLYGSLYGVFFFLPFNLLQVQGYSATAAGLALLPFTVLVFLLSRWSGGLVDRFGARRPLFVGPVVAAAGMTLFALPGIGGSYWSTFFPAVFGLGLGMAVTAAPLTTSVLASVEKDFAGIASGVNNAVSRVAGLCFIALLGIIMLFTFSDQLTSRLAEVDAPHSVVEEVAAARTQLAAIEIQADIAPDMKQSVRRAIEESFVVGFRRIMLICAGLSAVGAMIVLISLRSEQRRSHR